MNAPLLIALASFCLAASITPGPNNMMLLSSGATFGLRRTLPHMVGISGGCAIMVLMLGWSLGGLAQRLPGLYPTLHIVSTAYLLWLAWRIATSSGPHEAAQRGGPLRVVDAAAFQWVNPKAWAMVLGAIGTFARPRHMATDVPVIAVVFVGVGLPCIALWAGSGSALKRWLRHPKALRAFNVSAAMLLVLSIAPGLWRDVKGALDHPPIATHGG